MTEVTEAPTAPQYQADLYLLAELVNGFVYYGDRLSAVLETVKVLRARPELAARLLAPGGGDE